MAKKKMKANNLVQDMTNLELGNELGGGTAQVDTQINEIKKTKNKKK